MNRKAVHGFRFAAGGAILLQITACLGPDPSLYITSTIFNALLSNLINIGVNALVPVT